MKKIFLKEYKYKVSRNSWRYWLAVVIELSAIFIWGIGLSEIYLLHKYNPATMLINIGGLFFTVGSLIFAKFVKVN